MNDAIAPIPQLSIVVAIISDTTTGRIDSSFLRGCLTALQNQIDPPPLEIIVPCLAEMADLKQLQTDFPQVIFCDVSDRISIARGGDQVHHQQIRAYGLMQARGNIIGLLEDVGRPDPHWCTEAVLAHRSDYAGIGGAMENGIDRPLNWAVYFCDFGRYQNPLPEGPSWFASDANITYKRAALESVRPVWQNAFHEPDVNAALMARNQQIALWPKLVVFQHRTGLELNSALKERVIWARSYAANRVRSASAARRVAFAAVTPFLPFVLTARVAATALRKRRATRPLIRAVPTIVRLTIAWSWGEFLGYVTGAANG